MSAFFNGFEQSEKRFTGIPAQFFSEILPNIQDLNELKIVLYLLWCAYTEGDFGLRFSEADIHQDKKFIDGLMGDPASKLEALTSALKLAAADGILIVVEKGQKYYFLNTPRGCAAADLFSKASSDENTPPLRATLDAIQPNIFRLYEENIGPLTPIIADALKDAQSEYSDDWISEAIQVAVTSNVRRWKYVEGILKRWQKEGRDGTNRRDSSEDYERYLKGEYGDIGKHW